MKIGVFVGFQSLETLEQKFATLRENGFDNCQLSCWTMEVINEESAVQVRTLAEKYGITISAVWAGWTGPMVWDFYEGPKTLGIVPEDLRELRIPQLKNASDFAKVLGVEDVITHMGFIPENPNDPIFPGFCDAVRDVALHCKANGQNLLFETGQETPVAMLRCFEEVGTGNLYVNLDTANLILYGKANPVDALDVFGKYVRNLHAKDGFYPTNGHELGHECRLGDGKVDFRAVLTKLHELGFDRYVTIEREISGEQQAKDIEYAKNYLQNILDEIYAK
ncbi:MAG: sugar phosphate isomerase/epimerase [Clostridia bacterium]|nr:sugar phosphate isomerase/epimerase [Clostridia bacterium]